MKRLIQTGMALLCLVTAGCACLPHEQVITAEQSASHTADSAKANRQAIRSVLMQQQTAWNRGDIVAFMQGYWRSPDLRFASGGTVTRGWQETSDRYHARYSDRAKMGVLSFSDLEIRLLAPDAAIVHGRWELERAEDAPSGLFTLVFRKFGDDWRIISDTTTSAD